MLLFIAIPVSFFSYFVILSVLVYFSLDFISCFINLSKKKSFTGRGVHEKIIFWGPTKLSNFFLPLKKKLKCVAITTRLVFDYFFVLQFSIQYFFLFSIIKDKKESFLECSYCIIIE